MLATKEYPPEILAFIEDMAAEDDIKTMAQEPDIKMTQNHYGYYMTVISTLSKHGPTGDNRINVMLWGDILIMAGANEQGVRDAIKVST